MKIKTVSCVCLWLLLVNVMNYICSCVETIYHYRHVCFSSWTWKAKNKSWRLPHTWQIIRCKRFVAFI